MSGKNSVVETVVVNQLYSVVHELHICVFKNCQLLNEIQEKIE